MGEPAVSPTYCPINGAYTFTYSVNDGTENSLECSGKSSEISDCPYGFGFNLKFRECSFGNMGKCTYSQQNFQDFLRTILWFCLEKSFFCHFEGHKNDFWRTILFAREETTEEYHLWEEKKQFFVLKKDNRNLCLLHDKELASDCAIFKKVFEKKSLKKHLLKHMANVSLRFKPNWSKQFLN